eukprot:IDg7055t1
MSLRLRAPRGSYAEYFPMGAVMLAIAPPGAPADDTRNVVSLTVEGRPEGSQHCEDAEVKAFGRGEDGRSQLNAANPYAKFDRPQPQCERTRLEGWHLVNQDCPEHAHGSFRYRIPLQAVFYELEKVRSYCMQSLYYLGGVLIDQREKLPGIRSLLDYCDSQLLRDYGEMGYVKAVRRLLDEHEGSGAFLDYLEVNCDLIRLGIGIRRDFRVMKPLA